MPRIQILEPIKTTNTENGALEAFRIRISSLPTLITSDKKVEVVTKKLLSSSD